jgi:competence protein ComEC
VLLTALVLSAGIAQGLYLPGALAFPILLLIGSLLPAFSGSRPGRQTRCRETGVPCTVLLAVTLVCGSLLGARAGIAIRRSCESALVSGSPIMARGTLTEDLGAARSPDSSRGGRRVGLEPAELFSKSGRCEIPRLTAFLDRSAENLRSGDQMVLSGEWLRLRTTPPGGSSLDLPGRTGILVEARTVDAPETVTGADSRIRHGDGYLTLLFRLRIALRARAARRLRERLPAAVDPTARALLLAERNDLAPELRRNFVDAGLAHLLAISGLHVGIVSGLLVAIASSIFRGGTRYPAAATAVGLYVIVLGAPLPALRAWILLAGWSLARFRGRPLRGADLLGAAAIVVLLTDPSALATPGFQLSFAGFSGVSLGLASSRGLGTIVGFPRSGLRSAAARTGRSLLLALAAGAGAFFATAPIAAWHFGRVAPVSIVSSLLGTPVVAVSIWSLAGALLPDPLGGAFSAAATAFLSLLHSLVLWFGERPGAHFDVTPPSVFLWLSWALAILALTDVARGARWTRALVPLLAALFLLTIGPATERLLGRSRNGQLCTLSVGQGDAAILRTPAGRWVVFDGGPSARPGAGREAVAAALRRRGAGSVALVTLSHPDLDHIGGLEAVVAEFPVGAVLDSGDPIPRAAYARLLAMASERGIPWLRARSGVRVHIDAVEILVLGPDSDGAGTAESTRTASNESSLILRVAAGDFRYVTSGDATKEAEQQALSAWPAESLRADILKVGHHGSRTSTSSAWLQTVRPSVAVISAGAGNRFGHPHREVTERIERSGVPLLWRTDRSGTLCVEFRQDGFWRIAGQTAWNRAAATRPEPRHED